MADAMETIEAALDAAPRAGAGKMTNGSAVDNLPVIAIAKGELPRMLDEADAALVAADAGLYRQRGRLVRVVRDQGKNSDGGATWTLRLSPVIHAHLLERLAAAACFVRYDSRSKRLVRDDPPRLLAEAYLGRDGQWGLPPLEGIISAPIIRHDGTILDQPGYDTATALLFISCDSAFPPIPARPTKRDAEHAFEALAKPLSAFPFVGPADRSVALSGIVTAVVRRVLPVAPLHAFTAPTAGSGKSYLVDLAAIVATGERVAVSSTGNEKYGGGELEKKIAASMLAGDLIVSFDNVERGPLGGDLLCQCLTQPVLKLRPFGVLKNIEAPNRSAFFATGNNLTIAGDMTRRVLLARLDPKCERPELRVFPFDALDYVREHRGELVAAVLTIVKAWLESGERGTPPLGGYAEWCRLVRDPLMWLGAADPIGTMDEIRASDPKLQTLKAVVRAWRTSFGAGQPNDEAGWIAVRQVVAGADVDLREILIVVSRGDQEINADRLGWWLRRQRDRRVSLDPSQNGVPAPLYWFERRDAHAGAEWRLVTEDATWSRF